MTKFQGRFFIIDDCLTELKCWVYEFDPMTDAKRSSEEWAESHIQECYDAKQLRELFGLPADGDLQVLFTADIDGKMSYGPDGDDYNEWLDVEKVAYQRVPEEFARYQVEIRFTPQEASAQGVVNVQEEPQRPQEAIPREVSSEAQGEQVQLSPVAAENVQRVLQDSFNKARRERLKTYPDITPVNYNGTYVPEVVQAAVERGFIPEITVNYKERRFRCATCGCYCLINDGTQPPETHKHQWTEDKPTNLSDIDYGH